MLTLKRIGAKVEKILFFFGVLLKNGQILVAGQVTLQKTFFEMRQSDKLLPELVLLLQIQLVLVGMISQAKKRFWSCKGSSFRSPVASCIWLSTAILRLLDYRTELYYHACDSRCQDETEHNFLKRKFSSIFVQIQSIWFLVQTLLFLQIL